jgi:hypothetical protein
MMARSRALRLTCLAISNALLLAAILIFAVGFFPYKPLLPGLAVYDDGQERQLWDDGAPEAVFDKVIFMVVDALRSDFVYGYDSDFKFTQRYTTVAAGRGHMLTVGYSLIRPCDAADRNDAQSKSHHHRLRTLLRRPDLQPR